MLYEKMNYGENLSWCRPYLSADEKSCVAINEGRIACGIINGEDAGYIMSKADEAVVAHRLAIAVNPDYADYDGWSDLDIAIDVMHEAGCSECPFRDDCDAMYEEEED